MPVQKTTPLTVGRGRLYLEVLQPGAVATGDEFYVAQTPQLSLGLETESLEHFDNDSGLNRRDDSLLLSVTRTLTFKTEAISDEVLALWVVGGLSTLTVDAVTGATQDVNPAAGRVAQLGSGAGVRNVSSLSVAGLDENTDYTLDADTGRIEWLNTDAVAAAGTVVATYSTEGYTLSRIATEQMQPLKAALRYVSDNPRGPNRDIYAGLVELTPDGDAPLKNGNEWLGLSMVATILAPADGGVDLFIDGRPQPAS